MEKQTVYTAADSVGPSRNISTIPKGHCEVGRHVLIKQLAAADHFHVSTIVFPGATDTGN